MATNADRVREIVKRVKSEQNITVASPEADVKAAKELVIQEAINVVKMKPYMAKTYVRDLWLEKPKAPRVVFSLQPKPFDKSNAPVRQVKVPSIDDEVKSDNNDNKIVDVGGVVEYNSGDDIMDSGLFDSIRGFSGYNDFGSAFNADY
jgi:hypothetical protein